MALHRVGCWLVWAFVVVGLVTWWQMTWMHDLLLRQAPYPTSHSVGANLRADICGAVPDWRPSWEGPVEAGRGGLGARAWLALQNRSAGQQPTAYDATREILAAVGESAPESAQALAVVQVGACDGDWEDSNDPMQALLSDSRVLALVVEPVPPLFQKLSTRLATLPSADRRLKPVNAAICMETSAATPFYIVSDQFAKDNPDAPHWQKSQLGSFKKSHLRKHHIPHKYIETINVPCLTPPKLLQTEGTPFGVGAPSRVDALIIDAEGLDGDLVRAFLGVESFRPALLIFEHKNLKRKALREVLAFLRSFHYVHWCDQDQIVALRAAPENAAPPLGG
eukprot:TRINITY_DN81738_c0_g1_i1.p1 TRINITY_DN81738_c0_g1~~TRINITY_DN81738_c0_g1_i1.p1  ORF type:complete len:337 (+),score=62.54 TRINITY_DN81738_c0_g1_i1:118-1128(+)